MSELVCLKTRLFKDFEEIESARSLCDYCVNVSLPTDIMRGTASFDVLRVKIGSGA